MFPSLERWKRRVERWIETSWLFDTRSQKVSPSGQLRTLKEEATAERKDWEKRQKLTAIRERKRVLDHLWNGAKAK